MVEKKICNCCKQEKDATTKHFKYRTDTTPSGKSFIAYLYPKCRKCEAILNEITALKNTRWLTRKQETRMIVLYARLEELREIQPSADVPLGDWRLSTWF